jgi:hypothetical protein
MLKKCEFTQHRSAFLTVQIFEVFKLTHILDGEDTNQKMKNIIDLKFEQNWVYDNKCLYCNTGQICPKLEESKSRNHLYHSDRFERDEALSDSSDTSDSDEERNNHFHQFPFFGDMFPFHMRFGGYSDSDSSDVW